MIEADSRYAEYLKNLEDADKRKVWSKLKLLTANEIVDKIVKGDKDFSNVKIFGIDWARRDLSGFDFSGSKIEWCVFSGCKLNNANFSGAFLDWCLFDSADLSKSSFKNSIVYDSGFIDADISNVDFTGGDLRRLLFANNVGRANFTNCTQVQIWYSIEDVLKETNIENIYRYVKKDGLSIPQGLTIKFKINEIKSSGEKLRLFYDIGREAINPEGNLNQYNLKQAGKPSLGEYGRHGVGGVYVAGTEYGKNRDKKGGNVYSK